MLEIQRPPSSMSLLVPSVLALKLAASMTTMRSSSCVVVTASESCPCPTLLCNQLQTLRMGSTSWPHVDPEGIDVALEASAWRLQHAKRAQMFTCGSWPLSQGCVRMCFGSTPYEAGAMIATQQQPPEAAHHIDIISML